MRDYEPHVLVDASLLPADLILARVLPVPLGDVAAAVGVGRLRVRPLHEYAVMAGVLLVVGVLGVVFEDGLELTLLGAQLL